MRGFRFLLASRAVSFLGSSLGLVALLLHVVDSTGRALAVAALLLAADFTPALLSPLTGAVSDRIDGRRLMVGSELVQAGLTLWLALTLPDLPVLLALVAGRAVAGQVFQAASRSAVPSLVPEPALAGANARLGLATNGAEAAGPLLAAVLVPALGVGGVLLLDAASFALSAVLLLGVPRLPTVRTERSLGGDARAGLRYLAASPVVRTVVLGFCAVVACNGMDDIALIVLARIDLRAGVLGVGLLLGAVGCGLLAGYALLARYAGRLPAVGLLLVGFGASSGGNLLTGLTGLTGFGTTAWALGAATAMQAGRGIGLAAMDVGSTTVLQRLVPAGMRGRVFANLYGGVGIAAAVSYLGGGLLLDATSAPVTLLLAGAAGLLATATVTARLRRDSAGAVSRRCG